MLLKVPKQRSQFVVGEMYSQSFVHDWLIENKWVYAFSPDRYVLVDGSKLSLTVTTKDHRFLFTYGPEHYDNQYKCEEIVEDSTHR